MKTRNTITSLMLANLFLAIVLTAPVVSCSADDAPPLIVFAAASLTEPLSELGPAYTRVSATDVRFSFAASSTLARQISAGANPGVYLSANSQWMEALAEQALLHPHSRTKFLSNELVLATAKDSNVQAFRFNADTRLEQLLKPGERIAVGDPDHVPIGIYTRLRLSQLGLWAGVEPLLARTDNTRATVALIERGETPFGFVYASDAALSKSLKVIATVPEQTIGGIIYELAIIDNSNPHAARFVEFLQTVYAREVFSKHNFVPLEN